MFFLFKKDLRTRSFHKGSNRQTKATEQCNKRDMKKTAERRPENQKQLLKPPNRKYVSGFQYEICISS